MTISTQALIDAFQTNDMAISFEGKDFGQLLAELGVEDKDGVMEYLDRRLDTQDFDQRAEGDVAIYLDGIAAGIRAVRMVATSMSERARFQ